MSYSFEFTAPNKPEAGIKAREEMHTQTQAQPGHDGDRQPVIEAIWSLIGCLAEDSTKDVSVKCYGHVGGAWSGLGLDKLTEVNCNISVKLVEKTA